MESLFLQDRPLWIQDKLLRLPDKSRRLYDIVRKFTFRTLEGVRCFRALTFENPRVLTVEIGFKKNESPLVLTVKVLTLSKAGNVKCRES
jgi:hypothetical protein